jgi:hypothetical protein
MQLQRSACDGTGMLRWNLFIVPVQHVAVKGDLSQWILIPVAVALLITNGFLIYQNIELRRAISQSKRFVTDVGYKFAEVPSTSLIGESVPITFGSDGKKTLLLVFNTNCQYCRQQYPYWRELVGSLDKSKWNIIAITTQSDAKLISSHLEENKLNGIDVRIVSTEKISEARMGYTPMTVSVDSSGVVRNVWAGLWVEGFTLNS